jgi:hypothetical protein
MFQRRKQCAVCTTHLWRCTRSGLGYVLLRLIGRVQMGLAVLFGAIGPNTTYRDSNILQIISAFETPKTSIGFGHFCDREPAPQRLRVLCKGLYHVR